VSVMTHARLLEFNANRSSGKKKQKTKNPWLDSMAHFLFTISNSGQSVSLSDVSDTKLGMGSHKHLRSTKARGFHGRVPVVPRVPNQSILCGHVKKTYLGHPS
jgi:hypothetical protein